MLLVLISLLSAVAIFALLCLNKGLFGEKSKKGEKVFSIVLVALFVVRLLSVKNFQMTSEFFEHTSPLDGPQIPLLNVIGNLCVWFEMTALIMVVLRSFFGFKTAIWYSKFISLSIFICCLLCLPHMLAMITESTDISFTGVFLAIEIGYGLALSIYHHVNDKDVHISKHSYPEVGVASVLINFATMPSFMLNFFFGLGPKNAHIYNISIHHRIYMYVFILILPVIFYFVMRKSTIYKIKYFLTFIALGTLFTFMMRDSWKDVITPWNWPLHLCNTCMFLITISLVFNAKRLFYFTYFINVFGAIMATLMPNYSSDAFIFQPDVITFLYNHVIAITLPLLCVALKVFPRPKLKQFFYSVIGFTAYFVLVLSLNVVFTAFDGTDVRMFDEIFTISETDFFFLNSTFLASKFGAYAENAYAIKASFEVGGRMFAFHPVYQVIYYFVYILIGFGMWFVYQLFFDISDSHYDLHIRLKGIRLDHIALQSVLNGRSIDEPMEGNVGTKLELKGFSKRYGNNTYFAVENANLEVNGGEVFGFLGPNGAGKSTIIKSIVGIQPITSGDIYICGFDVKSQPVQAKSLIGFVPDHYALYEKLTGREYLNYIADIYEVNKKDRDERLAEYIKIFELEASIDNKIKTYSHGMKQKITIISALVHNPKVWILDEPLTGLDPQSIFQVKECMRKHAEKGNIVFFSSHLIDIVEKLCDRIAIIKHGHIECVKTVEEIEKTGKTLEDFYMSKINDKDGKKAKETRAKKGKK